MIRVGGVGVVYVPIFHCFVLLNINSYLAITDRIHSFNNMLFHENFCLPQFNVEKLGIEYGDPLLLLHKKRLI
jgi:hypothetical protein